METLNRFMRLASVFIEGRGMPFLGAGISMDAGVGKDENWKPQVGWMVDRLIKEILAKLLNSPEELQQPLFATLGNENPNFFTEKDALKEELKIHINNRLGHFCDAIISHRLLYLSEIVSCLQIRKYVNLQPTPAHYFISFLVRETLVNEAITTNYDCCLERAVYHSHGINGNGQSDPDKKTQSAISIFNLRTYRRDAARRLPPDNNSTILRVYKINGCAGKLSRDATYSKNILLTEKQLQHMDNRAWAKDLLLDRARSRSFVFSGFGSDEPQVRFTLLRLLEEFNDKDNQEGKADVANVIWIQLYGKYLTQTQRQLLNGFWPKETEEFYQNFYFSGNDHQKLHIYCGGDVATASSNESAETLTADLFWQTLFQLVFLALVERHTSPSHPGWHLLKSIDQPGKAVQRKMALQEWLDPYQIGKKILDGNANLSSLIPKSPRPLQRIHSILAYKQGNRTGIPLCHWLRAFTGKSMVADDATLPEVYYIPLVKQSNVVLLLLCLYCFFSNNTGTKEPPPFSVESPGEGNESYLFLQVPAGKILLLNEFSKHSLELAVEEYQRTTILVGFHEQYSNYSTGSPEEWRFVIKTQSGNKIAIRRMVPVSMTDIIFACDEILKNKKDSSPDEKEKQFMALTTAIFERRVRNMIDTPMHKAILHRSV